MKIAGFKKTSLVDYPGTISAVIFLSGCNFRCGFCHNPSIVFGKAAKIEENEVMDLLKRRKRVLEGVCVTGGEPTIHDNLPLLFKKIKSMGFLAKLDTNGTNPEMLEKVIGEQIVDYIAMDIKAPLEKYSFAANADVNIQKIKQSISILMDSKIEYEFRMTLIPKFVDIDSFKEVCQMLKGAKRFYIQQFEKGSEMIDYSFKSEKAYTDEELDKFLDIAKEYFEVCGIRNA